MMILRQNESLFCTNYKDHRVTSDFGNYSFVISDDKSSILITSDISQWNRDQVVGKIRSLRQDRHPADILITYF